MREVLIVLLQEVGEILQVRLILVVGSTGLVEVRDELAAAGRAVEVVTERRGQANGVLNVEVGLDRVVGRVLVELAA